MKNYKIATFTKWTQSDGTHYPYNIRTICAIDPANAINEYKRRFPTENKIDFWEESK